MPSNQNVTFPPRHIHATKFRTLDRWCIAACRRLGVHSPYCVRELSIRKTLLETQSRGSTLMLATWLCSYSHACLVSLVASGEKSPSPSPRSSHQRVLPQKNVAEPSGCTRMLQSVPERRTAHLRPVRDHDSLPTRASSSGPIDKAQSFAPSC